MRQTRYLLGVLLAASFLGACGESPEEEKKKNAGLFYEQSDSMLQGGVKMEEPEGPQYQTPTIDVLRGKPQLFPAKYPAKRYPGSKVAIVDVRPNRAPGFKNHVMLYTSDPLPNVSQFYTKQLATDSWKKVGEYRNSIYESTIWEKGDMECEVRVSQDLRADAGDKKNIQLLYGRKGKNFVTN